MATCLLTIDERAHMLNAIREALRSIEAEEFQPQGVQGPQSLEPIELHLDKLIEIVRRSTAQRIEPYLAQILDEICGTCPQSQPSMFCPQRYGGNCVLFRHARLILETIAKVLEEMHDPDYLAQHGAGAL